MNMNSERLQTTPFMVWFGGCSSEHDASIKSFANIYGTYLKATSPPAHLTCIAYTNLEGRTLLSQFDPARDPRYYRRSGVSYMTLLEVAKRFKEADIFIFSLLHGQLGEDGHVQGFAKLLGLRGSFGSVVSASIGMSKLHGLRQVVGGHSQLKVPKTLPVYHGESLDVSRLAMVFGDRPIVIKPNSLGASIMAEAFPNVIECEEEIHDLLKRIFEYDSIALAQTYVSGVEYSCGCLERAGKIEALPLVRIVTDRKFFGHAEKHKADLASEVVIDVESECETETRIREASRKLFTEFGLQHMGRFDYIYDGLDVYFLEVNPLPGLMANSLFPKMLKSVSLSVIDLVTIFADNEAQRPSLRTELRYDIAN